ncbi:MAG: CehA/McbA family metallohydrolase [Bryobacterales bacterium]|nr:CehA/McbA family metallohydrolase [Bryobacterales bacterium]
MIRVIALVLLTDLAVLAGTVQIRVKDERGQPAAVRLRLRDASGKLIPVRVVKPQPVLMTHPKFADLGVIFDGSVTIDLPDGDLRVLLDRGTEYEPATLNGARLKGVNTVRLRRWMDMAKLGWWSGDLHVHREPSEMPLLIRAADIHMAPVITRWNNARTSPEWKDWREPMQSSIDGNRVWTINNAEDERPWGAALFFNLRRPPDLAPYKSDWPPPVDSWTFRSEGYLDLEKPIWWGAPVVALLAHPDSIGVVNNHFMEEGMLNNEAWGRPRDLSVYPGYRGFADYICMLYARYLSAGLRIPVSAGSANGVLKNGLGYDRVYVHLDGPFSPDAWWSALKAGRSFATNGPMLWLTADGLLPGSILPDTTRSVKVQIEARSREPIDRVDILVDGNVVRTLRPTGGSLRVKASFEAPVQAGSWIAARCFGKTTITARMAHTSPIYVGPVPRRSPGAIRFLREWIGGWREVIRRTPESKLSGERKAAFFALCDRAEAALQ